MSDNFVHLHVHSEYSLLDGLSRTKDLAQRAVELGQPALALTDHGAMFGAVEFYKKAKDAGVKPIIGMEGYLAPRTRFDQDAKLDRSAYHLLLLAKDMTGYRNLMRLASVAQLEGFYYNPRVDKQILAECGSGLVCTTGCPSAEIPRLLLNGQEEPARQALDYYLQVFGRENFYVELQEHNIPEFVNLNRQLIALAKAAQLPLVATNDVHYVRLEDASVQDVLLCIQTNTLMSDPKRMRMSDNSYYLKSGQEMASIPIFAEYPEALRNTLAIAEMCTLSLDFKGYRLPNFPVPEDYTAESYLRMLCEQGAKRRYGTVTLEIRARLDWELKIIHQMGFDTYFLIVWDLCRHAREENIWWNVRGSAAGSVVAYTLNITNLDPLPHNLIFERFLNPGRVTMPDIDLDYPDDQRDRMIRYTVQKYGRDNVAQIITFGTLGAKAALRDVGRAMDVPLPEVDRLAKLIPVGPGVTLDDSLEKIAELKEVYDSTDYVRNLVDTARGLEGISRHASTHAAGVVVTDKPLVEYTPLHRSTKGAQVSDPDLQIAVTQYTMETLEAIGLLKVDFLGLSTLTIMREACHLIEQNHGIRYDLMNIPTDDARSFELLSSGEVTGVFQVESAGMRRVLTTMKPTQFEHIVATISLYRPGPMEYIDTYIARMHGKEKVEYRHTALEPILSETFGICVYQEQIIKMATDLAGYTAGDADLMRRAVGKKKKEDLLKHREQFVTGAVAKHGIPKEAADGIFDDVEFFARYGFNKAHAADYAVLTCQTAFLKAHYPVEFMTALMTAEHGNTEKIGLLVAECRKMGIEVLPPSINDGGLGFTIETVAGEAMGAIPTSALWQGRTEGKGIRFGLGAVKNVGEGPVQAILAARQEGGPFRSLDDFCRRVDLRQVNRRALECLIKVGALDEYGERPSLLAAIDQMMALSSQAHQARDVGQMLIFDLAEVGSEEADTLGELPTVAAVPHREILGWEKELVGTYVSAHPLQQYAAQLHDVVTAYSSQLAEEAHEARVTVAGVVSSVRQIMTKKNDPMAFVLLEDLQGTFEVVVFPRVYAEVRDLLQPDKLVIVRGKVDANGREPKVLADEVRTDFRVARVVTDGGNGKTNGHNGNGHGGNGHNAPPPVPSRAVATVVAPPDDAPADEQDGDEGTGNGLFREPEWLMAAPPPPDEAEAAPVFAPVPVPEVATQLVERAAAAPPPPATVAANPVRRIYITVVATAKLSRLQSLLAQVYDIVTDYAGYDRFSISVHCGDEPSYIVDFPNDKTGYCQEMHEKLAQLLGPEAIAVQDGLA